MDIIIRADHIEVRARVSNEEAFVAEAFDKNAQSDATLERVWQRHGQYLLAHLQLGTDGLLITGRLAEITLPENTETGKPYRLRFQVRSATRTAPARPDSPYRKRPERVRFRARQSVGSELHGADLRI